MVESGCKQLFGFLALRLSSYHTIPNHYLPVIRYHALLDKGETIKSRVIDGGGGDKSLLVFLAHRLFTQFTKATHSFPS